MKSILFKVIACVLCLSLLVSGILLLVLYSTKTSPEVSYRGNITFNSEEGYTDFKEYLMQPKVEITDIQTLVLETTIWVKYNVNVPRDWEFPYPYSSRKIPLTTRVLRYALMISVGIIGTFFSLFWSLETDKGVASK